MPYWSRSLLDLLYSQVPLRFRLVPPVPYRSSCRLLRRPGPVVLIRFRSGARMKGQDNAMTYRKWRSSPCRPAKAMLRASLLSLPLCAPRVLKRNEFQKIIIGLLHPTNRSSLAQDCQERKQCRDYLNIFSWGYQDLLEGGYLFR